MALTILGKVSKEIIKRLSLEESNTSLWVFADYSDGSYPKGFTFNCLLDFDQKKHQFTCKVKKITQQFGKHFEEIPEGWKTIIEIEYFQEENFFFNSLPILDKWEKGDNYVQLFE